MFLPRLPNSSNAKYKKSTIEWAGLNRRSLLKDNEFSATYNVSSAESPLITNRPSRSTSYTLTSGKALFAASKLAYVDGTKFYYDAVEKGDVTASAKSMVELSGRIVIFPDKKSYDTVGGTFAAFGTGTYPTAGSVPDIDYATVLDNRIWAVKGDNVYCTALGDFDDWTTFSSPSEATDAWQVDTGSNGSFTGITSFKGTNLVFKNDRVWKRFGDIPSNFQLVEISRLGCLSNKSICEVNNILFWLSPQGVVAYTGGIPEVIGEALNDNYVSAVAGGDGRRYYISLYNGTTYTLYVYDTWKGVWVSEDSLQAVDFAYLDGYLYALSADNNIYKFGSGTEKVEWSFETKEFSETVTNQKGYSEISMSVDLASGAYLNVYTRRNNGSYTLEKTYSYAQKSNFIIPLRIKPCNYFTIKLEGAGDCIVHQMVRVFYIGGK